MASEDGLIDRACDHFEESWRAGRRPRIEDYLATPFVPERRALLDELLRIEVELRHDGGEEPTLHEYQVRFDDHADVVQAVFDERTRPAWTCPEQARRVEWPSGADLDIPSGTSGMRPNATAHGHLTAALVARISQETPPRARFLLGRADEDGDGSERDLPPVGPIGRAREAIEETGGPDARAGLVLVSTARGPGADTEVPAPDEACGRPAAGSRFRILRLHDRGGLGDVFIAHDQELNREVALKRIRDQRADDADSRARFLAEAEITGRLEHPGIVPVYGLGRQDDGRPFYAMRFVKGESLLQAIHRFHEAGEAPGRDPAEQALALRRLLGRFLDACDAVEYAHSRGVLHRDLKPDNILLGPYGETLVIDWGLAKVIERGDVADGAEPALALSPDGGGSNNRADLVLGTPGYMSPEQAEGAPEQLGPPSDVYSLGATLYHLLTGRAAFDGGDDLTLRARILCGEFPAPRQVRRPIDSALEAICLKAMALRPEDRYPSPRALADDIEQWLGDEPVAAHRDAWSRRLARWTRRYRAWARAAAALALISVVSFAVIVTIRALGTRRPSR